MLKIMGLLSVLISVPILGSSDDFGLVAGIPAAAATATSALLEKSYTEEETLAITREVYGESLCPNCGKTYSVKISKRLMSLPKSTVDFFKASALEIKGAVDPTYSSGPTMINQLSIIASIGGLSEVKNSMTSFHEISSNISPVKSLYQVSQTLPLDLSFRKALSELFFLTSIDDHEKVIKTFKAQMTRIAASKNF